MSEQQVQAVSVKQGRDWFQDILDFHARFRPAHTLPTPAFPPEQSIKLVMRLVEEEVNEELLEVVRDAWGFDGLYPESELTPEQREQVRRDILAGIADACADSIVVIIGLAQAFGIDLRPVWEEVHRANMAKVGGDTREDGKILKPEGWTPPDVAGVLARQAPLR